MQECLSSCVFDKLAALFLSGTSVIEKGKTFLAVDTNAISSAM